MIEVLLAEDVHMVRGALVTLLNLEPDIRVTAEIAAGDEILPAACKRQPNVAILDIDLPGKDGLTAATEIHETLPECRTLILTSLGHPGTARRALAARVHGFIPKDLPSNKLAKAVRDVAGGRRVVDGDLALAAWEAADYPLTNREHEILRLVAKGHNADGIAAQLFLSTGTVRNYLTSVVHKLNARNRVDAIRIATESGWL
ncbi:two-component system, NarL family, response regulator DesR [Actinopolyspora lacussalsi subsp. righensis]|uniref:Two-component system, NarL family, response regulator DesR n=1 Tax=Actinopolyspora righensis TaxID=995060 RepID=A0A1I6XCK6_9ACTN|nr:response regulator transcription factor [Actinopolyspora righensis]SFT36040.1 two-component system, NarL family, response regulator DesR [Actinopolyspora righensis]